MIAHLSASPFIQTVWHELQKQTLLIQLEGAEKDLLRVYTADMIHRCRIPCAFTGALHPSLPYRPHGNQQELKHTLNPSSAYLCYPKPLQYFSIPWAASGAHWFYGFYLTSHTRERQKQDHSDLPPPFFSFSWWTVFGTSFQRSNQYITIRVTLTNQQELPLAVTHCDLKIVQHL